MLVKFGNLKIFGRTIISATLPCTSHHENLKTSPKLWKRKHHKKFRVPSSELLYFYTTHKKDNSDFSDYGAINLQAIAIQQIMKDIWQIYFKFERKVF